jgi:hypothetical protein
MPAPPEVFERTRHGPAQVTVPEIFFYVEGVVVELDPERQDDLARSSRSS